MERVFLVVGSGTVQSICCVSVPEVRFAVSRQSCWCACVDVRGY